MQTSSKYSDTNDQEYELLKHVAEEDGVSTLNADRQRFTKRVHLPTGQAGPAPNGCHLWTGAIDEDGYGTFNAGGKKLAAHIYAFGEVPEGHELDHLCHNADLTCPGDATCLHRRCVNKAHLEAVTHAVNLQRRHERAALIQQGLTTSVSTNADSDTPATKQARVHGRPFTRGDSRINTRGRPKKGESFAEQYVRAVQRDAHELIARHVQRAKGAGVVASKEFALAAAYAMGRPVQPYVVASEDAPGMAWLQALAPTSQVIEGESRLLTSGESDITSAVDLPDGEAGAQSET